MPEPEETSLEGTPTWIVASVCSGIVLMSFVFERALHRLGKALEHRRQTLYEALLKLKEELMLLGFGSLLLVVFQDVIQDICINESLMERWLPCRGASSAAAHHHRSIFSIFGRDGAGSARRRMLQGRPASEHCSNKAQEKKFWAHTRPPLDMPRPFRDKSHCSRFRPWNRSIVFIFVLAITHVVLSAITVLLGLLQMRKWMHWENAIQEEDDSGLEWQFNNYTFNLFYCRWYHWIFVMIFLLLNVTGWHSNFWISLIPLSLLLLIGAKLEHIINKLAYEVATKHTAAAEDEEGGVRMDGMVMSPSDDLFWFRSPRLVLILIRFILFQNAFFFWTLETFGVNSCMMDGLGYSVSRIVICVIVEVLCSYSTLPLYAIVTHMGRFRSAAPSSRTMSRSTSEAGPTARGGATGWPPPPLPGCRLVAEPSEEATGCTILCDEAT
ncbi:unnamed protein product [Miscanthus lutarioriparius]|uniref:MLO-like protein n=1 Tax=Miscanthus lutarioriparius TaxID=422564 RepID=A0A811SNP1_9POAL|nr:unnamed protein product [Miscanthus lutarioriparius]